MQATTWPEILELALRSGKEGAPRAFLALWNARPFLGVCEALLVFLRPVNPARQQHPSVS